MRLEDLCEREARIQIEIMGAIFGVSLNLLRTGIRCHGEGRQSFEQQFHIRQGDSMGS